MDRVDIKCGMYARPKADTWEGRIWRTQGIGVVTYVHEHTDCEPSVQVTFAGGALKHVMWASQWELSEWIDPMDCIF